MGRSAAARARRLKQNRKSQFTQADTRLAQWLATQNIAKIATAVGLTPMAVYAWYYGHSAPRPEHARRLIEVAAGQLSMSDIYAAPLSPSLSE